MSYIVCIERREGRLIMGKLEHNPRGAKVTQYIGPYSFKQAEHYAHVWDSEPGVIMTWVEPLNKPERFKASAVPF